MNESQLRFWEAVGQLNTKHREVILLRHVQDMEYAEIAETIDVPIGTVMSRLFHARRRLRGILEPYLEGRT